MSASAAGRCCGTCRSFRNDPAALEAWFAGLTVLGSGWASVRASDGVCLRHDVYLPMEAGCAGWQAVAAAHAE